MTELKIKNVRAYHTPDKDAVAVRHSLMLIRMRRTGKWHIAFVPKGARFGDSTGVHVFEEYSFRERDDALAAMRDAYDKIVEKAEALRVKAKALDKKS